jgi:hypothetical protein
MLIDSKLWLKRLDGHLVETVETKRLKKSDTWNKRIPSYIYSAIINRVNLWVRSMQ